MKNREYYRLTRILETGAQWYFLIGQRANGKSYAVKEHCITECLEHNKQMVYLRRWGKDIKQTSVESYFSDMPIKKLSKGVYDGILAYRGFLYFYSLDEDTNKPIKGKILGRYCSLNEDARYKSQVFENVHYIVYEEMIPNDNMYLDGNEPTRLQQFVSTVFRDRDGKIFLIGNTLSRVCPYVKEYCLDGFLKMKQGDIDVYNYKTNDSIIKLAVEYCASTHYDNKVFFGKASKQILTGEWDVTDSNHLPKPLEEYENIYEILIEYQNFKFILQLLVDNDSGGKICFIYPFTKDIKYYNGERILTDRFSDNPFISARLNMSCKPEQYIKECFILNKLCYSDNLTASDFKAINEHFKISTMTDF